MTTYALPRSYRAGETVRCVCGPELMQLGTATATRLTTQPTSNGPSPTGASIKCGKCGRLREMHLERPA